MIEEERVLNSDGFYIDEDIEFDENGKPKTFYQKHGFKLQTIGLIAVCIYDYVINGYYPLQRTLEWLGIV
tara:strand:- start:79 stop:288 length:210 start_codon:yes stop_codon:yes gene_type:complete